MWVRLGACHWSRRTSPQPFAPRGKGRFARVRGARQSADWLRPRPLRAPALSASVRRRGSLRPLRFARALDCCAICAAVLRKLRFLRRISGGELRRTWHGRVRAFRWRPRRRHHLRSSLRRKLSACAYPAAAFRRLAARRRHLPCRPAAMRIPCVIILHDWFLPSGLALAAKDKISPRHGCTNALRLQLRGAVERPGGPCAANPRGSAAGFRKRRARPKRKRMDAEAAGGEGNLAIAEPP